MPEYHIFSRNADLSKNLEITDFSNIELISRYNRAGSWQMDGEGPAPMTYQHGIIVERDNETIFTGVVKKIEKEMTANEFISRTWRIEGIDDLGRLSERYVHPNPTTLLMTPNAYDTRTGVAETVILGYINANCGSTAYSTRKFTNFQTGTDLGRGATITGNGRFYPLLDFIYDLGLRGSVGYRMRQDNTLGKLVFEIVSPTDRSASVKFSSEFGNLQSFKYVLERPKANHILALGQGEATARASSAVTQSSSVNNWGLIEMVKDQRNEPDSAKLVDWATAELKETLEKEGFDFATLQLADVGFLYGFDYFLGDKVSIYDDGITISDTVTEVTIKLDKNGDETITPTIGKLKDIPFKATFDKVSDLEDRVDTLETSQ